MQVVGVVQDIPRLCEKLVQMTFQDQQVYVYDEEELHWLTGDLRIDIKTQLLYITFHPYSLTTLHVSLKMLKSAAVPRLISALNT